MPKLTPRRRAFVEEYLKCWNSAEAARRVGYKHPDRQGSRLLSFVEVRELVNQRVSEIAMSADEIILRLTEDARGDMGDFMDISGVSFSLDLEKAKELGLTHLIKKVKDRVVMTSNEKGEETETHHIELELYDAQAAKDKLARIKGMYKDNVNVKTSGDLRIHIVYDDTIGFDAETAEADAETAGN